jgi:alanine or glycine:cation symporter, AGCS family
MDQLAKTIDQLATDMYWPWTVCILLATGVFFTVRTRWVQLRRFPEAVRTMVATQQSSAGGALSPFQAFMTGLAATIGVGNIAGVATAIIQGGPGALFWIWCYGFFAMAIKFSEAGLGLKFRIARGDQTLAGPMYYLRDGLKSPALAWIYALVAGIACLFTTPFTQPNSIAVALDGELKRNGANLGQWTLGAGNALELNRLVIGAALAVLTWLVIIGGVRSIGRAAEKLSPLKVTLYLIGGLIVIVTHLSELPAVLGMVFREAFSMQAGVGTAQGVGVWLALRYGLARGAYANEAGFGTAAVVYGVAKSDRPDQQGLNAVMEVFIITFVTSTISALTILLTGSWNVSNQRAAAVSAAPVPAAMSDPGLLVAGVATRAMLADANQKTAPQSSAAVAQAFETTMPGVGGWMLSVSVLLFGFTTLMGWAFYGEQFLEYLFGPRIIKPYRWLYCSLIPLGAIAKVNLVWAWGDILNGMQIFPNLIGLIALSGLAAKFAGRKAADGQPLPGQ